MRRTYMILLALLVSFAGYSQKKPKINKANSLRESGELAEAKEIIDAATTHEKTKDDGKTWYYRGLIYATIDTTSNEAHAALSDNALAIAMESFAKADEIDPEGKNYYVSGEFGIPRLKEQQVADYYSYYYNKAVAAFQDSQQEEAVNAFESAYVVLPSDTNAYINAAYAAHNGEMYDRAKKNYELALEMGASSRDLYMNYFSIVNTADGDKEAALDIINRALEVYPADGELLKNRINLLIEMERVDEAKDDLEEAIKDEPDNPNLYFTLAILKEQLDDYEGTVAAYKKAIEVDPDHYESNFNYGVLLINEANEVIKESNALGMSKADMKKSKELEPVIMNKLKAAMPQWERILEIKTDDVTAMETLMYIYTQLKMNKKAAAMSEKLDSME